jgi:hypothetical protein
VWWFGIRFIFAATAAVSRPTAGRLLPTGCFTFSGRGFRPPNLTEASRWFITRVAPAGIVEPAVPAAAPPPAAPGQVIAIPAVGISGFPCRAIDALGVAAWTGDYLRGHCGPCRQGDSCGSTENSKFHHAFLHYVGEIRNGHPDRRYDFYSGDDFKSVRLLDAELGRSRSIADIDQPRRSISIDEYAHRIRRFGGSL